MKAVARAGLAGHGIIYLLLGVLAVALAFGDAGGEADQRGALDSLAEHTGGSVLLVLVTIGLIAYALWRLVEAVVGTAGDAKERMASGVRAVIYGGLAASAIQILAQGHASSQKKQQQSWTAKIMANTGGRWLIGIVGLVVIGVGVYLVVQGVTRKVLDGLDLHDLDHRRAAGPSSGSGSSARSPAGSWWAWPASSSWSRRSPTTRRRPAAWTVPCARCVMRRPVRSCCASSRSG